MKKGIRCLNEQNVFSKWYQKVEECRSSGQKVRVWCKENGILVSTYYGWQKKVFETVKEEIGFAEIPQEIVNSSLNANKIVAEIEIRDVKVKIYAGTDELAIRNIITAVKSC